MSAPTAAALRAAVALFGTGTEYGPEWLAKRAAVIDRETALPKLTASAINADALMRNGFIAPEGVKADFKAGWDAACHEFRKSAARADLRAAIAEACR